MNKSDYKQLKVWQKALELTIEVYRLIRQLPKEENFAIANQMRRAAVSIPSNIAEGHGRDSNREFIQFLNIAKGSLYEIETQLIICSKLLYFDDNECKHALSLVSEISRMINSLINYRNSI